MFENYKDCLFNGEVILKSQQRFNSDHHKLYTEEVNKVALSSNEDKRLQTFDEIETYPYGTTNEMLKVFEAKMWKAKMYAKERMFLKICQSKYKWSILIITQMKIKLT